MTHQSSIAVLTLRIAVLAVFAGCAVQPADAPPTSSDPPTSGPPTYLNNHEPWPYPFSAAVRVGNMLYLAGQMGTRMENGTPTLVPGGIEPETRQALENIKAILTYAGSSMDKIVKCSVMMADMSEWPKMNAIYATYFPGPKPARSAWGANGLAFNGRVEIECWAAV
jgi:reactive intermediate/imine deaminase